MHRLALVLALTSLLAADDPPPETQPEQQVGDPIEYFGIETHATHVIFLIDRSGSMRWNPKDEPVKTKVQIMREETTKSIDLLQETTSFAVLFFAREVKSFQPQFVKATMANKNHAKKYVKEEGNGGPTFLWMGIQKAFQKLDALPPAEQAGIKPAIFILTDGKVPDEAEKQIRTGIKPLLAKWKPILNVVSFESDSPFLEALAKENGGKLICPVPPKDDDKKKR